jgi:hypothetical protein
MRFSLKTLLILVTALGLLLGYSQNRRRRMMRECELLREAGFYVELPRDFRDRLWQRKASGLSVSSETARMLFGGGPLKHREQLQTMADDLGLEKFWLPPIADEKTEKRMQAMNKKISEQSE